MCADLCKNIHYISVSIYIEEYTLYIHIDYVYLYVYIYVFYIYIYTHFIYINCGRKRVNLGESIASICQRC